jgi:hypothetical protein
VKARQAKARLEAVNVELPDPAVAAVLLEDWTLWAALVTRRQSGRSR